MTEFAINSAVHVSTGLTPFFVNNARHPRVPSLLAAERSVSAGASPLGVGGAPGVTASNLRGQQAASKRASSLTGSHQRAASDGHSSESIDSTRLTSGPPKAFSDDKSVNGVQTRAAAHAAAGEKERDRSTRSDKNRVEVNNRGSWQEWHDNGCLSHGTSHARGSLDNSKAVSEFLLQRQSIVRFVRDAIASTVDLQKKIADKRRRKKKEIFMIGDRVLLSTEGIKSEFATNTGTSKLAARYIGQFKVIKTLGDAYTLDIPTAMKLRLTLYVGRLKRYLPAVIPNLHDRTDESRARTATSSPSLHSAAHS